MTMVHTHTRPDERDLLLGPEIDGLLMHLRGLVLAQDLLAERGATAAEIDAHAKAADRVRTRLAELIGGS
jgi:hypothetical protein